MESNYHYQYPNDLNEKPKLWFWTFPELIAVVTVAMLSLLLFLRTKSVFFLALACVVAVVLAHFDDRSVWQHLMDKMKYWKNSNRWQYNPGINPNLVNQNPVQVSRKEQEKIRRKKEKQKKLSVVFVVAFMILFASLMVLSNSIASNQNKKNTTASSSTPKASETAKSEKDDGKVSMDGVGAVTFYENPVTISAGTAYDVSQNINTVTDPDSAVYQEVKDTSDLVPNSYCIITDNVDTNTAGTYKVSVLVADKDQKYSVFDFDLIVQ